MTDYLYHFTSQNHLTEILKDGYLKLTESNLYGPNDSRWYNPKLNKRVVWFTDSVEPERQGLDGSSLDKKEIRITVNKDFSKHQMWTVWVKKRKTDKAWVQALKSGMNFDSWFISEKPIPVSDFVKIEQKSVNGWIQYREPTPEDDER